ncbi:cation diffusion facilitator family transporter [Salisediminibacterium beveridgei]|uniref:Putative transporter ydfM n=1 Tax=Salisediminibacterium beveridgei TaxID=632773 RepID=A0A1D7QU34_9BACI|nr:cation diffusion facilitator family transporter [Salisediminibacterium beveridgei]AOM82530.1 putative transporter ydfM [Salisediminibacterium beveridgei]
MEDRFKKASFATWLGIIANAVLAVMKGITGWLSGSRALIADAAHSASDVVGSIAVLAGLKTAQKPPDKDHPYGHGKAENIATIIVAILLVVVGIEIAISSAGAFFGGVTRAPGMMALVVIIFSLIVKECLYHYKYRLAKKINSSALMAEAWHHRSDSISSMAALVGIGGAMAGQASGLPILFYLDPLAGIVVSLLVIRVGIKLAKESSQIMLEQVLSDEETKPMAEAVQKVDGVIRVDELLARTHGHYMIVDIKVSVEPSITVEDGHTISKQVKKCLTKEFQSIQNVFVHINPYRTDDDRKVVDINDQKTIQERA